MVAELQVEEQEQIDQETTSGVRRMRISREMYMGMLEAGVITENQRIQLIDGEIYEMSPSYKPHWIAIRRLEYLLEGRLPSGWAHLSQDAIVTDKYGEPEPDVAVFRGSVMTMKDKATGGETALVVEVSDSTLAFDRKKKLPAYAEAGIPEYWIVNLVDRVIEVYTEPHPRDGQSRGKYAALREYRADEKIAIRLDGQFVVEFTVGDLFI